MKNNFYITTPIYYVNDIPHIGHAYTTILADVIARYQRSLDKNVFFLTGLDEHGQKVQDAANSNKTDPLSHCNNMSKRFTDLWAKLHISNNDFIRTTQKRHIKVVQNILNEVMKNGDIYEDEYEGLYSVSEERFITEKEADTGDFHDIKKLKEKNYFFKMSKYQKNLIEHINSNPQFIMPSHRKNEIIGFLNNPLNDLCISRPKSRLSWGIELPFDSDYVTYVWFDALINYITAPGYLENKNNFEKLWPANIHLIGKDILTTHAVYWPTMLLSAGIALPKTIFAHGWWLTGDDKMSKSKGNVINPMGLIDVYGVDPVRYYLMREMVLGQDANFTVESFNNRYNSDLANDFGNLLSRIATLINKNFNGIIPDIISFGVEESKIEKHAEQLIIKYDDLIEKISSGKFNFTKLICTPSMMAKIGKHGKVLGPKGLMPNPKLGTVTNDISKAVKDFKTGLTEIRNDKDGNLASSIGRKSFSTEKLIENFNQFIDFVKKEKPSTTKGEFIKNIFITSTMGISYKVGAK